MTHIKNLLMGLGILILFIALPVGTYFGLEWIDQNVIAKMVIFFGIMLFLAYVVGDAFRSSRKSKS